MPKTKILETGKTEFNVRVPNLLPEEAKVIARDVRRTLENCGKLHLLNEFVETRMVEYAEVPVEEVKWGDQAWRQEPVPSEADARAEQGEDEINDKRDAEQMEGAGE